MKAIGERMYIFLIGAFMYSLIEIASRGFTHWTMCITGGLCLVLLYEADYLLKELPLGVKCIAGAVIITFMEFTVGTIVNNRLHWNVWDYSDMPLNIGVQICFPYSIGWFFLSFAGYGICYAVRKKLKYSAECTE